MQKKLVHYVIGKKEEIEIIKMKCKGLLLIIIFATMGFSTQKPIQISKSNITGYYLYPNFGLGDIVFDLNNLPVGTSGIYLSGSEPGTKTTFAGILQALSNGESILFYYEDSNRWEGSSMNYYKIDAVRIIFQ